MNGLFGSMFGELFLNRDCASILQDPNADPMDKDICQAFKEFNSSGFPSIDTIIDRGHDEGGPSQDKPDAQSLRDSILKRTPSTHHERKHRQYSKGDQDLDGQVAKGVDPSTLVEPEQRREAFSSYTRVTVTRKPDGTVEERRTHRDSLGNETETTVIRDSPSEQPTTWRKLSDWVWPKT
ncbi:HCLS1-associated protein X-1-like [Halichondria panicea]|uniref:HCLS1-associated protein X-1-like n=1 Tax=Halichondria panicea TaxID=6063 RepID=UPI00312B48C2